jgi:hypothetical protein
LDKQAYIEIKVEGKLGNLNLTPDTYDIRDIREVMEQVENLLFPEMKKGRPVISYQIEEGSVRHLFKTAMQAVIGFNAVIGQVNSDNNIDFLESNTAKVIEIFQETAVKKNYSITILTSLPESYKLQITPDTSFKRIEDFWVDSEFYFYGKLTNAGGKGKANIHVDTEDMGILRIDTPIAFLEKLDENVLYKPFGIRARGKQNIETGEIDKTSLSFIEMIDHHPGFDEDYLKSLRKKAGGWIQKIDTNQFLNQLRGRNGEGSTA